mgnify:CR=1 FL=1
MNKRRILFEIIQDFFMCIVITATVSFIRHSGLDLKKRVYGV